MIDHNKFRWAAIMDLREPLGSARVPASNLGMLRGLAKS